MGERVVPVYFYSQILSVVPAVKYYICRKMSPLRITQSCERLSLYRLKWVKILHVLLEIVPLQTKVGQNTARVAGDCPFTDYSGSKYCTCCWRLFLYRL